MKVSPASPLSPGIRANGHLYETYSVVGVKYITEEVAAQTAILSGIDRLPLPSHFSQDDCQREVRCDIMDMKLATPCKRPETTLHLQARITRARISAEILQDTQSNFRTRHLVRTREFIGPGKRTKTGGTPPRIGLYSTPILSIGQVGLRCIVCGRRGWFRGPLARPVSNGQPSFTQVQPPVQVARWHPKTSLNRYGAF